MDAIDDRHSVSEAQIGPSSRTGPRILFLTFDVDYMSPTRQQIKKAMVSACDIVLFGPGHVTPDEVEAGPGAFYDKHGPFDIVIGDEGALIPPPKSAAELPLRSFKNHACRFDRSLIWKGADYYRFLQDYDGTRVISLMQSDFYNFTEDMIERLEEVGDYFMLWGEEFILAREEADLRDLIPGSVNDSIYKAWNDRYLAFLRRNRRRVLSTPELVDAHEFCDRRLARRPKEWSVLGADYNARVTARARLDAAGVSRAGKALPYLTLAALRAGLNIYAHHWTLAVFNGVFRRALQRSRFGFTCGGLGKYAIRKFYEIPASGAVLVTDGCQGFRALGFVDRDNAVLCEPEEILEAHAWLSSDLDRAQAIADRGRALVASTHSVEARGRQLADSLERVHQGRFQGSYWAEGALCYR